MREEMLQKAEGQLLMAGVLYLGRYHREGSTVIYELLKKGSITKSTDCNLVGDSELKVNY